VRNTAIYGLYDPRKPKTIFYVGKGLSERADSHWYTFVHGGRAVNKRVLAWFGELRAAGVEAKWRFLETDVPNSKWKAREKFWIAKLTTQTRCNVLAGGNHYPLTPSERAAVGRIGGKIAGKINAAKRGYFSRIARMASHDDKVRAGRIGGRKGGPSSAKTAKANGHGWYALTHAQRSRNGRAGGTKAGRITMARGLGIHNPKWLGVGGRKAKRMRVGIHAPGVAAKASSLGLRKLWSGTTKRQRISLMHPMHVGRGLAHPQCKFCQTTVGVMILTE
jgi:hypothetical protein